jgi:hypothetical protein
MTTTEDVVRAATRACGEIVTEIRPLDLTRPAPRARPPRRPRRFPGWVAPVTAAAAVIALAISLVLVRAIPNGPVVPPTASAGPAGPVAPIAGVPEYYVTLHPANPVAQSGLVIGDTFSGARLATIAPPRGDGFVGVTGAADDRTFVVSTMPANWGVEPPPVTWYLLRIAPGGTPGYRLTRLAIPDMKSWAAPAIALSGSGKQLAMTLLPVKPPSSGGPFPGGWELRTYSVATGKLLGSWSVSGPAARSGGFAFPGDQDQPLGWADGDRAVVFQYFDTIGAKASVLRESERLLDVAARSGDLIADSQVIWSTLMTGGGQAVAHRCYPGTPPRVTADGKSVLCGTGPVGAKQGRSRVTLEWLASATTGPEVPRVLYRVTVDVPSGYGTVTSVSWAGTSGGPVIAFWSDHRGSSSDTHFGVIRHGQFLPLPPVPIAPYWGELPAVAW